MARIVIVGCGCRGVELARVLIQDGHAVRGTTRDPARADELESAGIEAWVGDPDRIATINYAMENATILFWALASAAGPDEESLTALHGSRLQMMLERTIDSTVRGVLYEARGTLPGEVLCTGAGLVEEGCHKNEIPWAIVDEDPADHVAWLRGAKDAIDGLLSLDRG